MKPGDTVANPGHIDYVTGLNGRFVQQPAHTAEVHWYEATGIGPKEYKLRHLLDEPMTTSCQNDLRFAICLNNADYPAALEVRTIYQVLPDPDAARHDVLRIIDESGDDYLYPASDFVLVDLPQSVQESLLSAA